MKRLLKAMGLVLVGVLLLWPGTMNTGSEEKANLCQGENITANEGDICRYPVDRALQQYRLELGWELQTTA